MRNGIMVWTCTLFFLMALNLSFGIIPSWAEEAGAAYDESTESEEDTEDEGLSDESVDGWLSGEAKENMEHGDLSDESIEGWLSGEAKENTEGEGEEEPPAVAEVDERVEKEKEWLRSEIRKIKKRPMSLAMRKTKIKMLKDKFDLLKNSPEEYFRTNPQHNKEEGK
jgi:hypothetical protein